MDRIVEINDLSCGYDDKPILQGVDLIVEEGDFVALLGPNGSGKSTLLKSIIGDLKPQVGEIKLFGQSITDFDNWEKVGYVSQQVRSFNNSFPATVKEVVGASLYREMGFFKLLTNNLETRIDQALKQVDMLEYKTRQIGNLSGGQQQRVFIARTLITNPEIILLDEPLVGVDAKVQDDFYQLIEHLNQKLGITIIMISHDIHVISSQANKIVCFGDGQLFIHQADEFDYEDYITELKTENRVLIPEHKH
ncbi:metal ABC transporter ATP-binding protein [Halanaerocella petrolearia]